jgi:hypothetical protein
MSFGLTFGSLGDLITVATILKQVIDALKESTGSSRDYQDLICQLQSLDRILIEVDQVITNSETRGPTKVPLSAENAIKR